MIFVENGFRVGFRVPRTLPFNLPPGVMFKNAGGVERRLQPLGKLGAVALRTGGLVVDHEEPALFGASDPIGEAGEHNLWRKA